MTSYTEQRRQDILEVVGELSEETQGALFMAVSRLKSRLDIDDASALELLVTVYATDDTSPCMPLPQE